MCWVSQGAEAAFPRDFVTCPRKIRCGLSSVPLPAFWAGGGEGEIFGPGSSFVLKTQHKKSCNRVTDTMTP